MDKIGVVILNYKTYKDTIRLVRDLQTFSDIDLQIVVVDNCSPNESYEELKKTFRNVSNIDTIKADENGGYAKGNNIGLRFLEKYNPEYVLILNNDIYFDKTTLEECIKQYKLLPDAGAIAPVQTLPNGKITNFKSLKCNTFWNDLMRYSIINNKYGKKHKYLSNTQWHDIQEVEIIPGCFLFMKFSRFKDADYFFEGTFLFCEERFLFRRFSELGYKNYIVINKSYIHDHSKTIKDEFSLISQMKLLNEGCITYTKYYRKFPTLKSFLLRIACKQGMIKIKLLNRIKGK